MVCFELLFQQTGSEVAAKGDSDDVYGSGY